MLNRILFWIQFGFFPQPSTHEQEARVVKAHLSGHMYNMLAEVERHDEPRTARKTTTLFRVCCLAKACGFEAQVAEIRGDLWEWGVVIVDL